MAANRRLKQERVLRGWSQAKLAEQIGTDATTVSRWERGLFFPTPYFRERLCTLFDKNAEELGLLEISTQPLEAAFPPTSFQPPQDLPALPSRAEPHAEILDTKTLVPPLPSWSKREDTFTYILSSAAYDRYAHMLWEDAYVRILRGQNEAAQQLGEASLQAFAQVGHTNAQAIREWLDQRDSLSPQLPTANKSSSVHAPHSGGLKRSIRRIMSAVGTALALGLITISTLILSGHTFNLPSFTLLGQSSLSSIVALQPAPGQVSPSAIQASHAATPAPTSSPRTATTLVIPPTQSAPTPATPSIITSQVTPISLTASSCFLEPLGYRCTLTLSLFTSNQGTFTWRASSTNVAVMQFNPVAGTSVSGQPVQVIVYVASSSLGRKGQLVFTFTFARASCTTSVLWQG
ncbi:MAG TPA: helix-turn-helix domain-containing protein [Ktedonosporobacter sp.]|nr:helix-turn-helix domain-containing protein [Ktedonosporobacter sp.]